MDTLFNIVGLIVYTALLLIALWGGFCVVLAWRRVANIRFRDESEQNEFLDELDEHLLEGKFEDAAELCEEDRRAMPQLALYAIEIRDSEFPKIRRRLAERFQQDVLADLEHHLSWVSTVVKSAPMIGLFGTVIGMMGAFGKLSSGSKVDTSLMAENIMVALITTACGLAIAVPLVILSASINIRIRKTENLIGLGMARLLDTMKTITGSGS